MSVSTRNPLRMAGANLASGNVNTGELSFNRGGAQAGCFYSGAFLQGTAAAPGSLGSGGNYLLVSGAGRLNTVAIHQNIQVLSGVAITFYDSAVIKLSGVAVSASGQRILTTTIAPGGVSGQQTLSNVNMQVDAPFQSGLCVEALSGAPGFTWTYTPEANLPNPG